MAKVLRARVTFLSESEGGQSIRALSGIRPQLKLGSIQTSSIVRAEDGSEVFEPGSPYDVSIDVMFWDQYGDLFDPEAPVELYNGTRLIARGTFLNDA